MSLRVWSTSAGGGGGTWGSITGVLSAQTDLQAALDAKLSSSNNLSDLQSASTARTNLGLGTLATQSGTFSGTSSGTNTGDQTITLTGGVTGSGTGSFAATVITNANLTGDVTSVGNATTIGTNKVTLAMLATIATATFHGRTTAGTGNVESLTATQATALLNVFGPDSGAGGVKGLAPATVAGDSAKFLKGDGTWATPSSGATLTATQIGFGNGSNALAGSVNLTWTDASSKLWLSDQSGTPQASLHLDTSATSNTTMLRLTTATTGNGSGDGLVLGFPFASNDVYFENKESTGTIYVRTNATNRIQLTTTITQFNSPDGGSGFIQIKNTTPYIRMEGSAHDFYMGDNGVGIDQSVPTAKLHLPAGSTSANTAPIKFTSGALTTSAIAGQLEYNGLFYSTKASNIRFGLSGVLTQDFVDAGNTTTAETDLYSYTSPASLFDVNGISIKAVYGGIFVNSTSTKQLKVYFGGTVIFDSGALTVSASSSWTCDLLIVRVSSSVVRTTVTLSTSGASTGSYSVYTEVTGLTLSVTNILKITGTAAGVGAATNDIVAKLSNVSLLPNN